MTKEGREMKGSCDYELAIHEIHMSLRALEDLIVTDKFEGIKALEFLLSFNPAMHNQQDIGIKLDAISTICESHKKYARTILVQSIRYEVPIWGAYKGIIQRVIDRRRF